MTIFEDPLVLALLDTATPTLILEVNTPEFTIITYNKAYEKVTYGTNRKIKGLGFWEAFDPDKAGLSGPSLLLEAFNNAIEKQSIVQMEPLQYNIPSISPNIWELNWWDVKIRPVVYNCKVNYLLINVVNITDKILHQDAIEQAIMKELTMAENLATANVKLNAAIQNLAENNDELNKTQNKLEDLNNKLEHMVHERTMDLFESEAKQRKLIDTAPVAIAVLKGPDHIVETANKKIIEYWSKTADVIDKPLAIAIPELDGQPFISILDEVRESGIAYKNSELQAFLYFNGVLQPRYYDMIYQPIQNIAGFTDSIFIVAFDITEHVNVRKKLEQSESIIRLAVTAANIGIWSLDVVKSQLVYNELFAQILGWEQETQMTVEQAIAQVVEECREMLLENIRNAISKGGEYDVTYAQKRFNDAKIIWLRAIGKITLNYSGNQKIFSGVIIELTDKQQLG
jgi:two-component system sensor histidine kinase VicK